MKFKRLNEGSLQKYHKIVKILKKYSMKDALKRLETVEEDYERTGNLSDEEMYNLTLQYGLPWFEEIKEVLEE